MTVSSDSSEEGDNSTPVTMDTAFVALETLPFRLEPNLDHSDTSLQAFLDSGLPGYTMEAPDGTLQSEEPGIAQTETEIAAQGSWSSDDDDDGDEVLDLIDMRKHWTTPTEGFDTWDEDGNQGNSLGLNIVPNTWILGDDDGQTWSFSDAEKLKHWQTYENKDLQSLKLHWSDMDDHGNEIWARHDESRESSDQTDESCGNNKLKPRGIPHNWSLDRDLSALWTDNTEHIKRIAVDHNENPVNLEEHAQSWPMQHYLGSGNYGNKHWLSAAEETILYPSDWIVDERHSVTVEQHSQPQNEAKQYNNNNKPAGTTKHWSLGDHVEQDEFAASLLERHFSLQDSDLSRHHQLWDPNDSREDIESLWIHPAGVETTTTSSGLMATSVGGHGNEQEDSRTEARHWSVSAEEVEARSNAHWFTGSDDVFVTENVSDDQSPEVSTMTRFFLHVTLLHCLNINACVKVYRRVSGAANQYFTIRGDGYWGQSRPRPRNGYSSNSVCSDNFLHSRTVAIKINSG